MLTSQEFKRYNRHIILPEFGEKKQIRLKESKVLVIGAGGLGCPLLLYLCAAGIGNITILDGDTVEESNLQRQILYNTEDIGKPKAFVAAEKLKKSNPYINILAITEYLSTENCIELFQDHDIIVDGSDNFPTRYLSNDASILTGKPLVFGSIFKFEGQVSVFNYQGGPSYRCLFPEPPSPEDVPNCSEIGVIGVLPGIIGTLQANEVIKLISGIGEPLSGKLLIYDALSNKQFTMEIANSGLPPIEKLEDNYEAFCGQKTESSDIVDKNEINSQELFSLLSNKSNILLIDVRERWEVEICKIEGSLHIPLRQIPDNLNQFNPQKNIVIYCHHGIRSKNAISYLELQGFENLINLKGGIEEWALNVDPTMNRY